MGNILYNDKSNSNEVKKDIIQCRICKYYMNMNNPIFLIHSHDNYNDKLICCRCLIKYDYLYYSCSSMT